MTGAAAPTDAAGHTMVLARPATPTLRATTAQDIPSNHVAVCVAANGVTCPDGPPATDPSAAGHADVITEHAGRGLDLGRRRARTRSTSRKGGRDQVDCGAGDGPR